MEIKRKSQDGLALFSIGVLFITEFMSASRMKPSVLHSAHANETIGNPVPHCGGPEELVHQVRSARLDAGTGYSIAIQSPNYKSRHYCRR